MLGFLVLGLEKESIFTKSLFSFIEGYTFAHTVCFIICVSQYTYFVLLDFSHVKTSFHCIKLSSNVCLILFFFFFLICKVGIKFRTWSQES